MPASWLLVLCIALPIAAVAAPPASLEDLFPREIQGFELMKLITGDQARGKVSSLHGKDIPLKDAAVATYSRKSGHPAMVWISRAATPKENQSQMEVMVKKMLAAKRSPFHEYKGLELHGTVVHRFFGMGQVHYTYAHKDLSYWISVDPEFGQDFLNAFTPR